MHVVIVVVLHDLSSGEVLVGVLLRDWDRVVHCLSPVTRAPAAEKTQFRVVLLPLAEDDCSLLLLVLFLLFGRTVGLYFRLFGSTSDWLRLSFLLLLSSVQAKIIT